jgi:hypothetical protein
MAENLLQSYNLYLVKYNRALQCMLYGLSIFIWLLHSPGRYTPPAGTCLASCLSCRPATALLG